ncbi:MAG: hypothetical protein HYW49_07665 [Deltaproteobacteria bacterium]|nr:hypothetical protein [Deltaproteobacteria bacterium]
MRYRRFTPVFTLLNFALNVTLSIALPAALTAAFAPSPAVAREARVQGARFLSIGEFKSLAEDLSRKVNLFRDAWALDPEAEFFGGTSRDFLFWVKGRLREARTREEALKIAEKLRSMPVIDVRSFILTESDIDIAGTAMLDAQNYGVRKFDLVSKSRFDPATAEGKSELEQGYVPLEKIRLSSKGFVEWRGMGDGLKELYDGRPTVRYAPPELFAQTHYAKQGLNHPILLTLRYMRILGVNYFQEYGAGYPDQALLFDIDQESEAAVRMVIGDAGESSLRSFLDKPQFRKWLNASIGRAFRSYTNPTAARMLFKHFGVDKLLARYDGIEPFNQYVFVKNRNAARIEENLKTYGLDAKKLLTPASLLFEDGKLYHGTKSTEAFRNILLQGVLGSEGGSTGAGLYGVNKSTLKTAIEYGGGAADNVVTFEVSSQARCIDVTQGEGRRALEFVGGDFEKLEALFGADIVKYPYSPYAFVVKNAGVLSKPRGLTRNVMTIDSAIARAEEIATIEEFEVFWKSLGLASFTHDEVRLIVKSFLGSPLRRKTPAFYERIFTKVQISLQQVMRPISQPTSKFRRSGHSSPNPAFERALADTMALLAGLHAERDMTSQYTRILSYADMQYQLQNFFKDLPDELVPKLYAKLEITDIEKARLYESLWQHKDRESVKEYRKALLSEIVSKIQTPDDFADTLNSLYPVLSFEVLDFVTTDLMYAGLKKLTANAVSDPAILDGIMNDAKTHLLAHDDFAMLLLTAPAGLRPIILEKLSRPEQINHLYKLGGPLRNWSKPEKSSVLFSKSLPWVEFGPEALRSYDAYLEKRFDLFEYLNFVANAEKDVHGSVPVSRDNIATSILGLNPGYYAHTQWSQFIPQYAKLQTLADVAVRKLDSKGRERLFSLLNKAIDEYLTVPFASYISGETKPVTVLLHAWFGLPSSETFPVLSDRIIAALKTAMADEAHTESANRYRPLAEMFVKTMLRQPWARQRRDLLELAVSLPYHKWIETSDVQLNQAIALLVGEFPEWKQHPDLVLKLIRKMAADYERHIADEKRSSPSLSHDWAKDPSPGQKILAEILARPEWAGHPELSRAMHEDCARFLKRARP